MRINVPKITLLKNLQIVEHAVNDRSTLPILANVLLQSDGSELVVTATDLDVGIQCRFKLNPAGEKGAVTLPARKLTTIIKELPDEIISLEAKRNHTAILTCAGSSFRLPGLPAEDFPSLPSLSADGGIIVTQEALKKLVNNTSYAMSMEESRFIFNGALLTIQKQNLVMVAADGRRLAIAETPLSSERIKSQLSVVIPSKTVRELGRLLQADAEDDVEMNLLQDNQLVIKFGSVNIVTRLLEGQFPPYEKVIPAQNKQKLTCHRQPLIDAIRRASLMTTASSQAVVFELGKGRLVISKESPEVGSAREEMSVSYQGANMSVAFNPEYWLDILKVLSVDEVEIELSQPDKPAALRQPGLTYVVMPITIT